jgi:hypothetical protein
MTEITKKQTVDKIIEKLPSFSKFAADEANVWENHGKCRIYFGRLHIEILDGGVVDVGSNPYGISIMIRKIEGLSVK